MKLFLVLCLVSVIVLLNQAYANQEVQPSIAANAEQSDISSVASSTKIQYKDSSAVKVSFIKTLAVFLMMIVLAYGSIVLIKKIQRGGLSLKVEKTTLIKILESRKLDVKTYIHAVEISGLKYLVVQNGSSVQVQPILEQEIGGGA